MRGNEFCACPPSTDVISSSQVRLKFTLQTIERIELNSTHTDDWHSNKQQRQGNLQLNEFPGPF